MLVKTELNFNKLHEIGVGQGLNSTVWLAHDPQMNCNLAVKQIDKATFWNPNCFAEAQAVYAMEHPHIVRVQYCSEDATFGYMAMPYYPNGSLTDVLLSGPLSLSRMMDLAQDVLLGLGHIHSKGYLHLDLKPSNIFFSSNGRALIADFGQSRLTGPSGHVISPPVYKRIMPPEVLSSGQVAVVSDIYQAGALFYRALNGEKEWQEQVFPLSDDIQLRSSILAGKFPNRQKFLPHVPKRLRSALRKAILVSPTARFLTASDFGAELGRINLLIDWHCHEGSSGQLEWRGTPAGCSELIVDLKYAAKHWLTEIHTYSNGVRRAKGRDKLWGKYPTRARALLALKSVFESL